MDYKNVDDFLKKMNLSLEELEQHKGLIGECRQRELQNKESYLRCQENIPKLIESYQNFFNSLKKLYETTTNLKGKTFETIETSKKCLELVKKNTEGVKKLTRIVQEKLIKETLENPNVIKRYTNWNEKHLKN